MPSELSGGVAIPEHTPGAPLLAYPDLEVRDPARLQAVHATGLLDAPAEESFDRLTRLAARLLKVPASFLSLVDRERDFYLAATGFGEPLASARELAGRTFCHFTVAGSTPETPLVIPDTAGDPVYGAVPTVQTLGVAAYVGVPLQVNGQPVGAFCAIDTAPRPWTDDEVEVMRELAASAQREIELRLALARARGTAEQIERSAREREEFLNATTDGVYTIDAQGLILFANHAAAEQLGYRQDELVGREAHTLFHYAYPDGTPYPREACAIARAATEGRAVYVQNEVLWRRDGTPFPVAYASSPVRRGGETIGAVVRFTDVTEQKRALDGLHLLAQSGRALSSSLDVDETLQAVASLAVPALAEMVMVDIVEDGDEVRRVAACHADEELRELFDEARRFPPRIGDNSPQSEAMRTGAPLLLGDLDEAWIRAMQRGPEHGALVRRMQPRSLIVAPLRSRGQVLGTLSFIRTDLSPHFDQADLELAEELALRAALAVENAQLYDSARNATRARDDMMGVVSHDLRNPIHSIFMSSSFLGDLLPEGMKVERTQAAVIKRSAERANRLIQDLLDITHIESGRLSLECEVYSASSIAGEALEQSAMPAAQAGVSLVRGEMDRDAPVLADRDRLVQALGNLIGNALKFTPRGGRITVSVRAAEGWVHVAVADTGPGVPPEQVPRLFDRFWQASRKDRRGVGLGLSIVKGIADAHGGEMRVETEVGAGSTFTLVLPAASPEP